MAWPAGVMTAHLITGPHAVAPSKVPIPPEQSDHVLVRVAYLGICGSDIELLHGDAYYLTEGLNTYPILFGHEVTGVVAAVGSSVIDYAVGDRVLGISLVTCGHCSMCRKGRRNLCTEKAELGLQRLDGAAADYVSLPQRALTPVPDSLPLAHATLVEPSVVVAHALRRVNLSYNDSVAVVGTGTLGLVGVQLVSKIARHVDAVGIEAAQLTLAKELGADRAIRPEDVEPNSYDVVLEFSGAAPTYGWLARAAVPGGRIALAGVTNTNIPNFNPAEITLKDLQIHGVFDGIDDYDEMLGAFASGLIDPIPLIDRILPSARLFEALQLVDTRQLTRAKVLVEFSSDPAFPHNDTAKTTEHNRKGHS